MLRPPAVRATALVLVALLIASCAAAAPVPAPTQPVSAPSSIDAAAPTKAIATDEATPPTESHATDTPAVSTGPEPVSGGPQPDPSPTPSTGPLVGGPGAPSPHAARYITHGSRTRKWIAFTFDADMKQYMWDSRSRNRWYDPRIVRLLDDTNTPATVFLNGLFVKAYPQVIQQLVANPDIELANHSWDHAGWTNPCALIPSIAPPMTKRLEVVKTENIVRQQTGREMKYWRFPAGCRTNADIRFVKRLGETSIGWDNYLGDALSWSVRHMIRHVKQTAAKGSIMVMHLNGPPYHPGTYEAIRVLIPWLKARGWKFVTVGQMLNG